MSKPDTSAMLATFKSPAIVKTAAGEIGPHETVVYADSTAGAMTLTMCSASRARPNVPYIVRHTVDNGNVTIAFPEGAHNPADGVMTAVGDHMILVSDGNFWYVMVDVTT